MYFISKEKSIRSILYVAIVLLSVACSEQKRTTVKYYPPHTPFVFNTSVNVTGNIRKDEKKRLITDLENYWDDSLQVKKLQKFGLFYTIKKPPVYDSANINRSIKFMNSYLNSQGYYYATFRAPVVKYDSTTAKRKKEIRAIISLDIDLGKNVTIGNVKDSLLDSGLQKLSDQNNLYSYLKKGSPYTKQGVNNELDRQVHLFNQNGYYAFKRDHIYALVDTTDIRLLQLTLDPFIQAELLTQAAAKKKKNPIWDITIVQRPITDSNVIRQYYVGNTYFYPETTDYYDADNLIRKKDFKEYVHNSFVMKYTQGKFKYKVLRDNTYQHKGNLYNVDLFSKSVNALTQVGAWKQVDVKVVPRNKDTLDFHYFLIPTKKQNTTVDLEGSRNTGDIAVGNLLGISTNITYRNRNVWKRAIQSVTSLHTGVELSMIDTSHTLQTFIISLSHSYIFPKLLIGNNWEAFSKYDNKQSIFSTNLSYTDRFEIFRLRSLISSLGFQVHKGNTMWTVRLPNVELYSLDQLAGLDSLIKYNPFLKLSFNTGNVVGASISRTTTFNSKVARNRSHFIRIGGEESGAGFFNSLKDNVYRFVKAEVEYRQLNKFPKAELAYRFFAGAGINYSNSNEIGTVLPFYKQFFAGGPNSMRAWGLRQLGLGSSILYDTTNSSFRDRFGDMQLETNLEYRFIIFNFGSFNIGSAVYADMGNIWDIKKDNLDPDGYFRFSHLAKDIAIGVGTGLRFDFSYFLIRLDAAYKVKDPARQYNNGWFDISHIQLSEKRSNGLEVDDYAFQLGIGLPF